MNEHANSKMKTDAMTSRRVFWATPPPAAATISIVPRHVLGGQGNTPPSEKLNIAGIGIGGMGGHNLSSMRE